MLLKRFIAYLVIITLCHIVLLVPQVCFSQPAATALSFTLEDLEGKNFDLSNHLGKKAILLNFWATFCLPCLAELKEFQKLYEKHKPNGFLFVAVSKDQPQTISRVRSFIKARGYTFPTVFDSEQKVSNLYNVSALPTSIFIDQKGKIIRRTESYYEGDAVVWDSLITQVTTKQMKTDSVSIKQDTVSLAADFTMNGSNFLRANYGKEKRTEPSNAQWLENWFDFRTGKGPLSYKLRFKVYQFLRTIPQSRDVLIRNPTHRVTRQLLKYDGKGFNVQTGNIYMNIGRGLLVRTFEDRNARIDKDLKGVDARIAPPSIPYLHDTRLEVFGGKVYDRFTDIYYLEADENNVRNTYLQGVTLGVKPRANLKLTLHGMEALRDKLFRNARFMGGSIESQIKNLSLYWGYTDVSGEDKFSFPNDFSGNAVYTALSASMGKLEAGLEYKYYNNYDFDFTDPPNLLKFHTFRLMARNLLFSNNQREEGIQLNGAYHFSPDKIYVVNVSAIEAHPERNNVDMVFHNKLPFWDIDQTFRFPLGENGSLLLDGNVNIQKRFNKEFLYPGTMTSSEFPDSSLAKFRAGFEDITAYTAGLLWDRVLSRDYSIQLESEYQFKSIAFKEFVTPATQGDLGKAGKLFHKDGIHQGVFLISLAKTAQWSISADVEVTSNITEADSTRFYHKIPGIKNGWSSLFITYDLLKQSKATLWAGQRKERVICSGGTCRLEPAFEGVELIITSYF